MTIRSQIRLGAAAMLAVVLFGTQAYAQRPDVTRMSCDQAQQFILQNGPVVVTTGRHTYDKFYPYSRQCGMPYVGEPTFVRTRDGVECLIGYRCIAGGYAPFLWDD